MRGVTYSFQKSKKGEFISTHTPHARRDTVQAAPPKLFHVISTHTPHARRDMCQCDKNHEIELFQLTRLMRGVTNTAAQYDMYASFQLTRLMRGVTRKVLNG